MPGRASLLSFSCVRKPPEVCLAGWPAPVGMRVPARPEVNIRCGITADIAAAVPKVFFLVGNQVRHAAVPGGGDRHASGGTVQHTLVAPTAPGIDDRAASGRAAFPRRLQLHEQRRTVRRRSKLCGSGQHQRPLASPCRGAKVLGHEVAGRSVERRARPGLHDDGDAWVRLGGARRCRETGHRKVKHPSLQAGHARNIAHVPARVATPAAWRPCT